MIAAERYRNVAVPFEQPIELEHAFARHDHLLVAHGCRFEVHLRQREPVPIGCNRAELLSLRLEQEPVQVVPYVLLRHREVRLLNQRAKVATRQTQRLFRRDFLDDRKVRRPKRRQRESAASPLHREPLAVEGDLDRRALRQRTANLVKLPTWHRDVAIRRAIDGRFRNHLDFQVGCGYTQPALFDGEQNIAEDRHRLPALDHSDHRLQRLQNRFASCTELHCCYCLCFNTVIAIDRAYNSNNRAFTSLFNHLHKICGGETARDPCVLSV